MRKNKLFLYGALAGAGYLLYKHLHTPVAPVVVLPSAGPQPVAGFGRLGYLRDGSDRPFQSRMTPGLYYRNWQ